MYVLLAFLNFLQSNDKFSFCSQKDSFPCTYFWLFLLFTVKRQVFGTRVRGTALFFPRTPLGGRTLHTRKTKVYTGLITRPR